MRSVTAIAVFVLLAASAQSADAEYLHCYNGDAPETAQPGPPELQRKILFLEFGLVITLYRKACGLTDETDRQYIAALYGQAGCTQKSDVGQTLERVLEADLSEIEGLETFDQQRADHADYVEEFCALVEETPWPVYRADFTPISRELYSGYQKSLQAIEEHKHRYAEKLESD